jgi:hypothetical protein
MAVVQGVKEKVHLPIYDSIKVQPEEQWSNADSVGGSSTLKFFVDVQGKTKLETNLQSAGLLPHYNTFEARAMRVVISDLPPEFPNDDPQVSTDAPFDVVDDNNDALGYDTTKTTNGVLTGSAVTSSNALTVSLKDIGLSDLVDFLHSAEDDPDNEVGITVDDDNFIDQSTIEAGTTALNSAQITDLTDFGGQIILTIPDIEDLLNRIPDTQQPLDEQIHRNNGAGTLLGKVVYNTVTTFYVGEKIMIQMPTWFFPSGAGPYSETGAIVTHGEPTPLATFRFAEPIYIDKQQNFRVEIEVPDSDVLKDFQRIYGPLFIWVVLDGYMTRDVQ